MIDPTQQIKNGNVLKSLKDFWFIVALIFSATFAWSEIKGSVNFTQTQTKNSKSLYKQM